MRRYAIFLNGPIGAGKTTLGRALAEGLAGGFIDGDDHSDPALPWYGSILRTSRSVLQAGLSVLEQRLVVVIAYPLGCGTWIFYKRHFEAAGVRPIFVSLRASYEGIVDPARGREFSTDERGRIQVMLREGYAERSFSDLIINSDRQSFNATLDNLKAQVMRLMMGG